MNQTRGIVGAMVEPRRYPAFSVLVKSCLSACALVVLVLGGVCAKDGPGFLLLFQHGDNLTYAQIQERLMTFNAIGVMPLVSVADSEIDPAVDSMNLPAAAKKTLLADLAGHTALEKTPPDAQAAPSDAQSEPGKETVAAEDRVRLAWISLWDTDVEDGDTVRIDSQGYSRTVVLKNKPVTFAIPVPANGIVNVTGVSDGDGGGITVGLASGASKAVFPIMSEGQVLGLKVRVN